MFFADTMPFVRYAAHHKLTYLNNVELMAKDSRLFYIVTGTGKITIADITYDLMPDTIILFREAVQYKWGASKIEYYSLNFDYNREFMHIARAFSPSLVDAFDETTVFSCGYIEDFTQLNEPIVIHNAASLKNRILNVILEQSIADNYSAHYIPLLTKELIFDILRLSASDYTNKSNDTKSLKKIKKVIEYIHSNYSSSLKIQSIAKEFGFSPSHLGRLFKKYTGQSIYNFILQHRIQLAKEFLVTSDLDVNEVGDKVGFNDAYHFSKIFKNKTGTTPFQYRKTYSNIQVQNKQIDLKNRRTKSIL